MTEDLQDKDRKIRARERLVELDIDRFLSITLDLFKWVTAATLTINGAPLVAMLGSDKLRPLLLGPGVVFAVGLACSVFGNLLLIKGLALAGEALFKAHWVGESVNAENYDDVAPDSDANSWSIWASVLLGLSILLFLAGIIWLGISVRSI
jgi:hypothetical protein